jgi:hypothetical protein
MRVRVRVCARARACVCLWDRMIKKDNKSMIEFYCFLVNLSYYIHELYNRSVVAKFLLFLVRIRFMCNFFREYPVNIPLELSEIALSYLCSRWRLFFILS